MSRSPLRIGITELRRRPGTQRDVEVVTTLTGLEVTSARVAADVEIVVSATLESIEGGITISGTVSAPWSGECRRCLEDVGGELEVTLSEVFEPKPVEGETYPIEGEEVDLEPVVRDAILLSLPLAPLCRSDCAGPAPDAFPTAVEGEEQAEGEPPVDPRWAALEQLKFD